LESVGGENDTLVSCLLIVRGAVETLLDVLFSSWHVCECVCVVPPGTGLLMVMTACSLDEHPQDLFGQ